MKKGLKILFGVLLGLIIVLLVSYTIIYAIYNKPLPVGQSGPNADALAEKMLGTIKHDAYKNTRYLEWSYAGGAHQYKWDKAVGKVQVVWGDYRVLLNLNNPDKSDVFEHNLKVTGNSKKALIEKAILYFNNDSFWLVAPFKVFDTGTQRSLVKSKDGSTKLLVTYTRGGSTPGDSYLWKLDSNGLPVSFQLWVDIIPIDGLEATWDGWQLMESGTYLPTSHQFGPLTLKLGKVQGYN